MYFLSAIVSFFRKHFENIFVFRDFKHYKIESHDVKNLLNIFQKIIIN